MSGVEVSALEAAPTGGVAPIPLPLPESTPLTRREARELERQLSRRRHPRRVGAHTAPRRARRLRPRSALALLFSALLVVGVSVPVNAFAPQPVSAEGAAVGDAMGPPQTLSVPSNASPSLPTRDGFQVLSYAQTLALKYAGTPYGYTVTSGSIRWPFPYEVPITDRFGPRDGGFHKGVDFAAGPGTPIYAIADGVATVSTFDDSGYGQHVVLRHRINGAIVESLYGHMVLGSSPIVAGQRVKVGDFLGLVGDTGKANGPHLHFEIHLDSVPVDPFDWLQRNAID